MSHTNGHFLKAVVGSCLKNLVERGDGLGDGVDGVDVGTDEDDGGDHAATLGGAPGWMPDSGPGPGIHIWPLGRRASGSAGGAQVALDGGAGHDVGRACGRDPGEQPGGSVRGQDYQQASDAARAQDSLNQFNANMRQGAIDARNRQAQQGFANQMTLKNNRNTARAGLGEFYDGRAGRNRETAQDIGAGIQGGMQSSANYLRKKGQ
mgnify:CR=1 FL=1